jgi:membrane dipeptidase
MKYSGRICDMTLPYLRENRGREAILAKYLQLGFSYVSLSVGADGTRVGETMQNIADIHAQIGRDPDKYLLVRRFDDLDLAERTGRLAISFNFQGCDPLESDINLLALYHDLGLRQMLLVYNEMNAAATGCHERIDAGLSRFGQRLIGEMNRIGMLVDCTHTGVRATLEIMEMSSSPVIFSHSNSRVIFDHERNITDEQIRRCAATGGLVGVTGVGKFMSARGSADVGDLLPHIRHIIDLVGPQHVGLGIDNVYFVDQLYDKFKAFPDRWPKGYPPPPWHYFDPADIHALADGLLRLGLSDAEVAGIMGENFRRVAREVWS